MLGVHSDTPGIVLMVLKYREIGIKLTIRKNYKKNI